VSSTVGCGQRVTTSISQTRTRHMTNCSRTIRYKSRDSDGIFKVRRAAPSGFLRIDVCNFNVYCLDFYMYLKQCFWNPCWSSANMYGEIRRTNLITNSVISTVSSGKWEFPSTCSDVLPCLILRRCQVIWRWNYPILRVTQEVISMKFVEYFWVVKGV
jgi:hypothetical protein